MKVFKACLLIIKRRSSSFLIYFCIFLALSVIMPMLASDEYATDFSEMQPNFTVINRDGDTPLADGLVTYLSGHGNHVLLDDNKEALQDASFYNATDYIIILPQGFHEAFIAGNPPAIETITNTDSARGHYTDMLVNQYMNQVRLAGAKGFRDEQAVVNSALSDLSHEARVEMRRFGIGNPVDTSYQLYTTFMCYIIIVLILLSVSQITRVFRRPDLRMRNLSAPLKPRSLSLQQVLVGLLVTIAAWLLMTVLGLIMYGSGLAGVDTRIIGLLLLNSFIVSVVALALAAVVCPMLRTANAQNAAANVLGLGLCFLGGVFVPLEILGDRMLAVSRFTPLYWYVTAVQDISSLTSFSAETMSPIWQALLTQLIFAAAFFCVALLLSKQLNSSEQSFGSTQTELEA